MSQPAIKIEGLSKLYRLGTRAPYHRLTDTLLGLIKHPFSLLTGHSSPSTSAPPTTAADSATESRFSDAPPGYFWSLKDVSFEVPEGQVVGIIGRNGAGKSTLLKILSRITEPTRGQIRIRGRVGSLLEVGTGFHPELTGRENIFLNGAILGMKRAEIQRKFDEIVAFSEIEKFLDSPVKHYSSGMYMRLAFAVAAHLEPEVLIVDEVLAVGDAGFQKKCLGKMGQVAQSGRTILFVSHSMSAVQNLCQQCILIEAGKIKSAGLTNVVLDEYLRQSNNDTATTWLNPKIHYSDARVVIQAIRIANNDNLTTSSVIPIEIEYRVKQPALPLSIGIVIRSENGTLLLSSANRPSANLTIDPWFNKPYPVGFYKTTCEIPSDLLNTERYFITANIYSSISTLEAQVENAVVLDISESGSMRAEFTGEWLGLIRPRLKWQTATLRLPTS